MLITQIKAQQLDARRARRTLEAHALTTLIGEAEVIGKNSNREVTDLEVVALVKKFIKNAEETRRIAEQYGNHIAVQQLTEELGFYAEFLPQQLSDAKLLTIITDLHVQNPAIKMGDIMKHLKENYQGQYDGATAGVLIKQVLV